VTVGQGDGGLGLAARVSGKGLTHAHILVMEEIIDKIRARIAAGGMAEMSDAADTRGLRGDGRRVRADARGFRRPEAVRRK
jgi:hypothetical protein